MHCVVCTQLDTIHSVVLATKLQPVKESLWSANLTFIWYQNNIRATLATRDIFPVQSPKGPAVPADGWISRKSQTIGLQLSFSMYKIVITQWSAPPWDSFETCNLVIWSKYIYIYALNSPRGGGKHFIVTHSSSGYNIHIAMARVHIQYHSAYCSKEYSAHCSAQYSAHCIAQHITKAVKPVPSVQSRMTSGSLSAMAPVLSRSSNWSRTEYSVTGNWVWSVHCHRRWRWQSGTAILSQYRHCSRATLVQPYCHSTDTAVEPH